ncbi:pantothenate synthetase [Rhodovulum bhavnagarense]|uniref:Pantothenate synthetase n=1 Tax=Rhodovulum bhavnagarense TaxID=992286 RepID=A0A4R2RP15_9RHOB|nr:pantoate--beta-alanine ligase [Rhodovulum bhavnagarense]TCP61561.1 pantothenate synthetase [Rhodovulum bhavnagarense]
MSAPILRRLSDLRSLSAQWRGEGARVAVVPTMGALHEGHLSLVRAARAGADRVIVTIFVNPRQFDNPDDLAGYPRTEERDASLLAPFAVDAIYAPGPDEVYPGGFATTVSVAGLTDRLCGAHRPGHFDGVTTVVAKLFNQTQAELAYFGEKDFQQLAVVRRMARDLDIAVDIIGCPTVREADGLALSSRNQRLTGAARAAAPALYAALRGAGRTIESGLPVAGALDKARAAILSGGFEAVDYVELCAADSLVPLDRLDRPARLLAAAHLAGVRLIDNIALSQA